MFIEEIKSKQGSKTYKTILVRESYREKGKVKHRTVANLSKLPEEYIRQLKMQMKGESGEFNLVDLKNGSSYEYGGSFTLKALAKEIGLEQALFSQKKQWREDVIAMITGRILFQGSKLSLVNTFKDSALWELAGHTYGERPDVEKNCYFAMDELLIRKNRIERKLAQKHLKNGCIILYDMTNFWLEGEYEDSSLASYGMPKGGKRGYKQIAVGLLTNNEGCPIGVEIFKGSTSDQTTVLGQIKKISKKFGINEVIFTGDRGMLTQKRIDEIKETDFKTITALTHKELASVVKKENIQLDLFDQMNITEIIDSDDNETRYMLCKNEKEMKKEGDTRTRMITKVETLLTQKANVKSARKVQKVAASVGRIFEKYKIEKFFNWNINEQGELSWNLKDDIIEKEKELDGCYVIKTDASKSIINKDETVDCYRNLQKVEQAFKNMKTILLELRHLFYNN